VTAPAPSVPHDPAGVSPPVGGYTHGRAVPGSARLLFISGQIPVGPDGAVPATFEGQCHAVWDNLLAVLADAVKVTTFLTDRDQADVNSRIRRERLGAARPALTVVVAATLESQWMLEIEAIAAG
jgi:2-iminobutanoate/2-iminopropanoate deaminase